MGRFKDFDAAEAERQREPITFRLGGREWNATHVNAASFLTFARQISAGGQNAVTGFGEYLTGVLAEDEREDFDRMLSDHDIQLSTVMSLTQWIVEQASGNPTAAASPSLPQQSNGTRPQRVVSLWPESTPEVSASAAG